MDTLQNPFAIGISHLALSEKIVIHQKMVELFWLFLSLASLQWYRYERKYLDYYTKLLLNVKLVP